MNAKSLAVALAALAVTALAAGGVGAAPLSAPDKEVQPADRPTVDGYEFAVVDHHNWLDDRDADGEAVAELLLADAETGGALRDLFEADKPLALDVYGALVQGGDAAHVVVTPAPGIDESSTSEQRPRVAAVVDLGDDTVRLVGASGARDESADAVTLNTSLWRSPSRSPSRTPPATRSSFRRSTVKSWTAIASPSRRCW
ncbi:hypothetical protein [Halobacterium sp. CBA1126]|uniref:hypothetical protein n=1 Tax=Halobacterium sp. CBA1126 TaxID=2668074 RepID=UPI0012F9BFC6|nr:hypothetical protein [Halobacterium sp. CBA1126]MUV61443.1 hypothetical protein [Halobacterium sp. CBA1126]